MSVVGIVVALVDRRPGESFEGLSFAFCVVTIPFAALLYWGGRIANRAKLFVDIPPEDAYVPGSIFGTTFLLLPVMLFAMALSASPDSYSDVDRFFVILMVLIPRWVWAGMGSHGDVRYSTEHGTVVSRVRQVPSPVVPRVRRLPANRAAFADPDRYWQVADGLWDRCPRAWNDGHQRDRPRRFHLTVIPPVVGPVHEFP